MPRKNSTPDYEDDDARDFVACMARARAFVTEKQKAKEDAVLSRARTEIGSVLDKFRHATDVTHKEDMQAWYNAFQTAVAKQDIVVSSAYNRISTLSTELENIIALLVEKITADLSRARNVGRECQLAISDGVALEERALQNLGVERERERASMIATRMRKRGSDAVRGSDDTLVDTEND